MNHIIQDISDFIFVSDYPKDADIIMVPGSSSPELPEAAAQLYHEGYSSMILIGGGVSIQYKEFPGPSSKSKIYNKDYKTEYEFYLDVLDKNDVPRDAIIGESESSFTRESGLFARRVVDENKISVRSALLVTKAFKARRCLMAYQAAFPAVDFSVIPISGFDITKDNWYQDEESIARVMNELRRIGDQFTVADVNQFKL